MVLVALSAAMFVIMPGRREFAASHEARVAQTARGLADGGWPWSAQKIEIERVHAVKRLGVLRLVPDPEAPPMHVNPWVVPVLTDEVRLQKPPLPYWCAAVLFKLFGTSEAMARLVPSLFGAAETLLVYDLARLLYSRRVAWIAALVWVTSYPVIEDFRLAMADPYLAFFTLVCVWSWIKGSGFGVQGSGKGDSAGTSPFPYYSLTPEPRTLNPSLLLFYVSLALGALSKGPLILLHVFVPVALFHVCFGRRPPVGWVSHLLGVAIFVAITLPWPLAVLHSVPNATEVWRYESVGELSGDNQEGTRPWWFYLATVPYLSLPWAGAWAVSLVYPCWRKRSQSFFPLIWLAVLVLIFSFVGQKKPPYLLPVMPAQALMIAVTLAPMIRLARRCHMRGLPGAVVLVQVVIGIGCAAALFAFVRGSPADRAVAFSLSGAATLIGLLAVRLMLRAQPVRWVVMQALAYAAILFVYYHFVETALNNERSPRPVARELAPMIDGNHVALLVTKLPEEVAFYLPLHPREGPAPSKYVVVLDDGKAVRERARKNQPAAPGPAPVEFQGWFPDARVTSVERIPMNSAPGDSRYKVYELTLVRSALARD